MKKIKNTYKGWNFDKQAKDALPIIVFNIYHILSNSTFQITIALNQSFVNLSSKKELSTIRLLYDYNYEIVLQDAEQILESIIRIGSVNFQEWRELYRFEEIRYNEESKVQIIHIRIRLIMGKGLQNIVLLYSESVQVLRRV